MKKLLTLILIATGTVGYAQVTDGGFEGGAGGYWTESSTNFVYVICNFADCGDANGTALPNTGSNFVWIGGAGQETNGTFPEVGTIEQSITIPVGSSATLEMSIHLLNASNAANPDDSAFVSIDGNPVFTVLSSDSSSYEEYTPVSIDVSSYADGNNHTLHFEGYQHLLNIDFSLLIDDVYLIVDGQILNVFEEDIELDIQVYPNPANDVINFKLSDKIATASVSVTGLNGDEVASYQIVNSIGLQTSLDVSSFETGLYLYTIESEGTFTRGKFEVLH